MSTEQNKGIVRRFFDEVCNKGKQEIIGEIFAENVSFNGKPGSHDDVLKYLKEIEDSFHDPHVEVKEQIAEGDMVSTRRVWTGTQKGDYRDQTSTRKPMTWTEISVVRFAGGKIVEDWVMQGNLSPASGQGNYRLKESDYLELWKYFSDHADHIKEKLWTTIIWHYTALAALLAFISKNFTTLGGGGESNFKITEPILFGLFSFIGLIFCIFTLLFVFGYGLHINSNWKSARRAKKRVEGLDTIVGKLKEEPDEEDKRPTKNWVTLYNELPSDARHIIKVTLGFVIIFLGLSVWSIMVLLEQ